MQPSTIWLPDTEEAAGAIKAYKTDTWEGSTVPPYNLGSKGISCDSPGEHSRMQHIHEEHVSAAYRPATIPYNFTAHMIPYLSACTLYRMCFEDRMVWRRMLQARQTL